MVRSPANKKPLSAEPPHCLSECALKGHKVASPKAAPFKEALFMAEVARLVKPCFSSLRPCAFDNTHEDIAVELLVALVSR